MMPTFKSLLSRTKSATLIVLLFLAPILVGCQTLGTGTAKTKVDNTACRLYGKATTYSGSRDTNETKRQIRVKNQRFKNYGCRI